MPIVLKRPRPGAPVSIRATPASHPEAVQAAEIPAAKVQCREADRVAEDVPPGVLPLDLDFFEPPLPPPGTYDEFDIFSLDLPFDPKYSQLPPPYSDDSFFDLFDNSKNQPEIRLPEIHVASVVGFDLPLTNVNPKVVLFAHEDWKGNAFYPLPFQNLGSRRASLDPVEAAAIRVSFGQGQLILGTDLSDHKKNEKKQFILFELQKAIQLALQADCTDWRLRTNTVVACIQGALSKLYIKIPSTCCGRCPIFFMTRATAPRGRCTTCGNAISHVAGTCASFFGMFDQRYSIQNLCESLLLALSCVFEHRWPNLESFRLYTDNVFCSAAATLLLSQGRIKEV